MPLRRFIDCIFECCVFVFLFLYNFETKPHDVCSWWKIFYSFIEIPTKKLTIILSYYTQWISSASSPSPSSCIVWLCWSWRKSSKRTIEQTNEQNPLKTECPRWVSLRLARPYLFIYACIHRCCLYKDKATYKYVNEWMNALKVWNLFHGI